MTPGRRELLRAFGAIADSPAGSRAAGQALGLPELDSHQHTEMFALSCPPYASVYLGPDGALGGEAPTGSPDSGESSASARLPSPTTCPPCSASTPAWARQ